MSRQQIETEENLTFAHNSRFVPSTKAVKKWVAVASANSPGYGGESLFTIAKGSCDYLSDCVLRFDAALWVLGSGTGVIRLGGLSYIDYIELRTSNSNVLVRHTRDSLYALSRRFMSAEEVSKWDVAVGISGGTDPLAAQSYYIPLNALWFSKHTDYSASLPVGLLASDLIVAVMYRTSTAVIDGAVTVTTAGALSNGILYLETVKAPSAIEEARASLAANGRIQYLIDDYVECPSQSVASGSTTADVECGGIPTAHCRYLLWGERISADLTTALDVNPTAWQNYTTYQISDGQGNVLGSSFYIPRRLELAVFNDDFPNAYSATNVLSIASFSLDPDLKSSQVNKSSGGIRLTQNPRLQITYGTATSQADTLYILASIHSVITIDAFGNISKSAL